MERKRSSSFCHRLNSFSLEPMILKKGFLRKKGIIFYNKRLVKLDVKGVLTYYDPKNLDVVRGEVDLKNPDITIKFSGKQKDTIEI